MKCFYDCSKEAIANCETCEKPLCNNHLLKVKGRVVCNREQCKSAIEDISPHPEVLEKLFQQNHRLYALSTRFPLVFGGALIFLGLHFYIKNNLMGDMLIFGVIGIGIVFLLIGVYMRIREWEKERNALKCFYDNKNKALAICSQCQRPLCIDHSLITEEGIVCSTGICTENKSF